MSKKSLALFLAAEACLCASVWFALGEGFGVCFTLVVIAFDLLIAAISNL